MLAACSVPVCAVVSAVYRNAKHLHGAGDYESEHRLDSIAKSVVADMKRKKQS